MKEKDKLERDAYVARMLERDKAKTKTTSVVENPSSISNLSYEEQIKYIPELRKISRAKYLEMREEQQLDLFKRRLEDEKRLFGDQPLTEMEKKINDLNERLFGLAQKRREKQSSA